MSKVGRVSMSASRARASGEGTSRGSGERGRASSRDARRAACDLPPRGEGSVCVVYVGRVRRLWCLCACTRRRGVWRTDEPAKASGGRCGSSEARGAYCVATRALRVSRQGGGRVWRARLAGGCGHVGVRVWPRERRTRRRGGRARAERGAAAAGARRHGRGGVRADFEVCGSTELCGGLCGVARVCAFASSGRCEEGRRVRGAEADERRAREQRARPAPKTARREPAGSSSVKTRVLRRQGTDERFLRFVVTARDFQVASLGCRGGDRWRAWVGVSRRRRSGRA